MKTRNKMTVCLLVCAFFSAHVHALRYTPIAPDTIIASWPKATSPELQKAQAAKRIQPNDPAAAATLANQYLALASMPGQSRLYGLAQATLKPHVDQGTLNPQVWLAWAQVLQHQHAFTESLAAIAKVTAQEEKNINANLLAARIYLIQDKPAEARQACLTLLGYSDLLTISTCILEITSQSQSQFQQASELNESYQQLATLVKREGMPDDERGSWLAQVLADMAMRAGDLTAAENWLAPQLENATVNYLAQWADIQFALGHYKNVSNHLTPIVLAAGEVDDLLLLQLAIAEKNTSESNASARSHVWQTQLAERVALREQRQDQQHASELARYYLDVNPQPQKALYWAELHWQNSRELSDKQLVDRARLANNSESSQQVENKKSEESTAQELPL